MKCISCGFEYTYEDNGKIVCSACQFEWDPNEIEKDSTELVLDSNNNELKDGDDVFVINDLKVKGSSQVIKQGTKVSNIRLVLNASDGHNIDCKIKDFGQMKLKSEFVKKANQ
ncbi:zinc ribbon domain-containing protein YjdM [Acholeplasma granularum]|uniref:zinc ribbon domain-containing protein YjdM n=1 Tax=Acholeplasma granularum TaxID=264635 RepID=UPI00046FC4CA|nr:zinc ribbon domain-containing protein YjdM [Acholeplasma granularum]